MALWGKQDDKTSTGTITVHANGQVVGSSTVFVDEAAVGDYIVVDGTDEHLLITSITSNTIVQTVAGTPGASITEMASGNAYSLNEKPIYVAASTGAAFGEGAANVYGVSTTEIAANVTNGMAHAGWVRRMASAGPGGVGTRFRYETLVAMSSISGDSADDAILLEFFASILTQPSAASANLIANANAVATFSVVTDVRPASGNVQYFWQVSTNTGATWANVSNGAVYTGVKTATLTVAAPTTLDGNEYRVKIWAGDSNTGFAELTSSNVALTVIE